MLVWQFPSLVLEKGMVMTTLHSFVRYFLLAAVLALFASACGEMPLSGDLESSDQITLADGSVGEVEQGLLAPSLTTWTATRRTYCPAGFDLWTKPVTSVEYLGFAEWYNVHLMGDTRYFLSGIKMYSITGQYTGDDSPVYFPVSSLGEEYKFEVWGLVADKAVGGPGSFGLAPVWQEWHGEYIFDLATGAFVKMYDWVYGPAFTVDTGVPFIEYAVHPQPGARRAGFVAWPGWRTSYAMRLSRLTCQTK